MFAQANFNPGDPGRNLEGKDVWASIEMSDKLLKQKGSFSRDDLRNQLDCAQKLFELFRESALEPERR